uniref:eCIS core domain-containing protein n=1 Tax=Candidatus Electronema sp. TaxID=2698783 RepID=UPI0040567FDA
MRASANRTQDNESRAVANNVSCKREERQAVHLVDNSPHTKRIAQFQAMMDKSMNPHQVQLRKFREMIDNSPQRKKIVLPGVTQKKGPLDEEELQFKAKDTAQLAGPLDEDELQFKSKEAVQKKGPLDEEELQFKVKDTAQLAGPLDEEELQFKAEEPVQKQENRTGLPDDLKAGVENLSGMAMDDVLVHYNSGKPAQLNAYAYTQGTEIHVAPRQEKHLPHEAWHVVQQKQGRVQPTMQMKGGVNVNDDAGLENEADVMGGKALRFEDNRPETVAQRKPKEMCIDAQVEKRKMDKSKAVTNFSAQEKSYGKQGFEVADNRPSSIMQRLLIQKDKSQESIADKKTSLKKCNTVQRMISGEAKKGDIVYDTIGGQWEILAIRNGFYTLSKTGESQQRIVHADTTDFSSTCQYLNIFQKLQEKIIHAADIAAKIPLLEKYLSAKSRISSGAAKIVNTIKGTDIGTEEERTPLIQIPLIGSHLDGEIETTEASAISIPTSIGIKNIPNLLIDISDAFATSLGGVAGVASSAVSVGMNLYKHRNVLQPYDQKNGPLGLISETKPDGTQEIVDLTWEAKKMERYKKNKQLNALVRSTKDLALGGGKGVGSILASGAVTGAIAGSVAPGIGTVAGVATGFGVALATTLASKGLDKTQDVASNNFYPDEYDDLLAIETLACYGNQDAKSILMDLDRNITDEDIKNRYAVKRILAAGKVPRPDRALPGL